MPRLGLGLGLNRGGFIPFAPLSLNPLLYYDARSSMVAPFEQPTLDLDPSNPSSLDIITATRAGVATYTDANGVIQSASPNTVRVDHVDGVPMILVEPAATNLVDYSNLDASGIWSSLGFDITQNAILSPDGLINGTKLEQTSTTRIIYGIFISSAIGTSVTYSFWVKKGSGSTHLNRFTIRNDSVAPFNQSGAINLDTGEIIQNDFGTGNLIVESYPNDWFRVKATRDTGISIGDQIRIYPPHASSDGTNETDQYNYTFGHQLEYGSAATSYIPTNGSTVTRNADDLVIDGSDFTDFYNASEGTVYIELTSEDDGKNSYPVYFTQDVAGNPQRNNGTWAIQKDGAPNMYLASWANGGFVSNSLITLGAYTAGDLTRVSVSYDSNSYEGSKDGASVATSTPTTMATTLVDRLYVGGSGIFQNSSRIKRLIYWPYHSDDL